MYTKDGGPAQVMATVNFQTLFFDAPVEANSNYCFWIEASSNGLQRASSSNRTCIQTDYPQVIAFNYLATVSTLSNSEIQVELLQDLNAEGTTYELYRDRGENNNFQKIATYEQSIDALLVYIDEDVDARNVRYRYRWEATDGCGFPLPQSNIGTNVVLTVYADSKELTNFLLWSPYEAWDGNVAGYEVYRKLSDEPDFTLLASLPGDVLNFDDVVEEFLLSGSEFCYLIKAVEGNNSFGFDGESWSNEFCVSQAPLIWIPNAIVINGQPENQIFKPVVGFIDFDSYEMEIRNKWGQRIFYSERVEDGWDGTFIGNFVREDFYKYTILYLDGSGKSYVEQGVLYVLNDS